MEKRSRRTCLLAFVGLCALVLTAVGSDDDLTPSPEKGRADQRSAMSDVKGIKKAEEALFVERRKDAEPSSEEDAAEMDDESETKEKAAEEVATARTKIIEALKASDINKIEEMNDEVPIIALPSRIFSSDKTLALAVQIDWSNAKADSEAAELSGKIFETRYRTPAARWMTVSLARSDGSGEVLLSTETGSSFLKTVTVSSFNLGETQVFKFEDDALLGVKSCKKLTATVCVACTGMTCTKKCKTFGVDLCPGAMKDNFETAYAMSKSCQKANALLLYSALKTAGERIMLQAAFDHAVEQQDELRMVGDELENGIFANEQALSEMHALIDIRRGCMSGGVVSWVRDMLLLSLRHNSAAQDAMTMLLRSGIQGVRAIQRAENGYPPLREEEKRSAVLREAGIGDFLQTDEAAFSLRASGARTLFLEEGSEAGAEAKVFEPVIAVAIVGAVGLFLGWTPTDVAAKMQGRGYETAVTCRMVFNVRERDPAAVGASSTWPGMETMVPANKVDTMDRVARRCILRLQQEHGAGKDVDGTDPDRVVERLGVNHVRFNDLLPRGEFIRAPFSRLWEWFTTKLAAGVLARVYNGAASIVGLRGLPCGLFDLMSHANMYLLVQVSKDKVNEAYRDEKVRFLPHEDTVGNLVELEKVSYGANKVTLVIEGVDVSKVDDGRIFDERRGARAAPSHSELELPVHGRRRVASADAWMGHPSGEIRREVEPEHELKVAEDDAADRVVPFEDGSHGSVENV